MTTKVKVPREVAEAIESKRDRGYGDYAIVRYASGVGIGNADVTLRKWAFDEDGGGSPDLLMQALVNGYEVEKTPEELQAIAHGKVRDYYAKLKSDESTARFWDDYDEVLACMRKRHATTDVLRMLDIKITGVNAK